MFKKILSFLPQILALLFLAAFAVYGWTEPTSAPPGGNVPAPLNVGSTGQSKSGGLILNTGGAAIGLIIDQGKVGIGTAEPGTYKLKVNGTGNITGNTDIGGNLTVGGTISASNYPQGGSLMGMFYVIPRYKCFNNSVCTYPNNYLGDALVNAGSVFVNVGDNSVITQLCQYLLDIATGGCNLNFSEWQTAAKCTSGLTQKSFPLDSFSEGNPINHPYYLGICTKP